MKESQFSGTGFITDRQASGSAHPAQEYAAASRREAQACLRRLKRSVVDLLEKCYIRLQPDHLDFVEVSIFESNSLLRGHASSQRKKARVASAEFDDAFVAAHGQESLESLSPWNKSKALRTTCGRARSAIKQLTPSRLLASSGYTEDQVAYARVTMKACQQDLDAWSLASLAAQATVLCLIGRQKDIAAGATLTADPLHASVDPKEMSLLSIFLKVSANHLNQHWRNHIV